METSHSQEPATPEEIWAVLREVSKQQAETDRLLEQQRKEADKRMRALEELFTGQWGKLMESLVEGDLVTLLQAHGIAVQMTYTHVKGRRNGEHCEYDIVAANGEDVVVVEVKTTLRADDVKHFLEKLSKFTTWAGQYRGHRILGAMAYLQAVQESEVYAERQGLYVIRATGSSARIINGAGFQPRAFE